MDQLIEDKQQVITLEPVVVKQNNFLIILLSILLLLSVSIAGFFAYQTQILVKELTLLKSSPTPLSVDESLVDPTEDWKMYTNEKFSFKYPETAFITGSGNNQALLIDGLKVNINLQGSHQWGEGMSKSEIDKLYLKSFQYPDKPEMGMYPDNAVIFSIEFDSVSEKVDHKKQTDILDNILSTFKFSEPSLNSADNDSQMIEVAAKTALVKKLGQEPTTKYGLSNESLKVVGDWAFGIITIAPVGEGAGPGASYFLARKINNIWEAKIEYTDEFREWLKISPNGLVSAELKQTLQ